MGLLTGSYVDRLSLYDTQGNRIAGYGGKGGSSRSLSCQDGKIMGIYGTADN